MTPVPGFTPTKFKHRCDCGRLFVVSQEAIEEVKLLQCTSDEHAAMSLIHCLHCIDGKPHSEELALDIRMIGQDGDDIGIQITLPTYAHWLALTGCFNVGFDPSALSPYTNPEEAAAAKEFSEALWEFGV